MPRISLIVNGLKITDCADDDEDMDIGLTIHAQDAKGTKSQIFRKKVEDYYVQEEGKVNHADYCTFFGGTSVANVADVDFLLFTVELATRDGDGYAWGGTMPIGHLRMKLPVRVKYRQDVRELPSSPHTFVLERGNAIAEESGIPGFPLGNDRQGSFTLTVTVTVL